MSDKPYDQEKISKVVEMFEEQGLTAPEALLASARLFTACLDHFKKDVRRFREEIGEDAIRDFASEEMNDLIYDIQDSIPVAVRVFNTMMRDPADENAPPAH